MYHALSYNGYLIQKILPTLPIDQIILVNRIARLLQFASALIVIIEIVGIRKTNEIVRFAVLPFAKVNHSLQQMEHERAQNEGNKENKYGPLIGLVVHHGPVVDHLVVLVRT